MTAPADPNPEHFRTTRWTRVLAARGSSPESKAALSDLCEAYYAPVHAYIQHTVRDLPADRTRDLTHEFFARLLTSPRLNGLERGRGKFRSYLLGAVKHYLADWRAAERAAKRGGGQVPASIDAPPDPGEASSGHDIATPAPSEAVYDRAWALAMLGRGLDQLAAEHEAAGQAARFDLLKAWLTGDAPLQSQAEISAQLDLSEAAVKVAIHRLRKRFRKLIRAEIAATVDGEADIGVELNYLIEALS